MLKTMDLVGAVLPVPCAGASDAGGRSCDHFFGGQSDAGCGCAVRPCGLRGAVGVQVNCCI